ncbi:uncharacterized protein PFL1_03139 [Pseudozyma flocculosa PF-1]|uniref:DASH complex subunit DAM1 n=2 Tax=Pseudozyma flocculosa TaxID=84751 RepID=A0A5C3F1L4_9BASI|nr:uncharacterized protein PFL1_03139 [Pseudozyma flocculosa PF-1]EPQ29384.1 hypothetical protein PFL1_03139 [Pseudozyma flocculosa PF-1]SPO37905.1 uncharacterized protein PSFLO_03382 [Pseudozyma flocculosa]
MATIKRPTTPLRRISRGSLNALSHSRGPSSSTPLSFLERALADLVDETSVLQANLEQVEDIQDALGTFNENFAMYMYGLRMNAWCVAWPEAPTEESFKRAEQRFTQQAEHYAAQQHLQSTIQGSHPYGHGSDLSMYGGSSAAGTGGGGAGMNPADQTYVTADDESVYPEPINVPAHGAQQPLKSALKPALKKGTTGAATAASGSTAKPATAAAKGKMTLAQKRKREAYSDEIIETLPLEFRGSDPKANSVAKGTIMALIAAGKKGIRAAEIVKSPDMPQAKVNKTLIALVAAKHATKVSNNGVVYMLDPARHSNLP